MLIKINTKENTNYQLKIMKDFGDKKGNELIGLNAIKKLKMKNIAKTM